MSGLIESIVHMVNWRKLAISVHYCPVCGAKTIFVRLNTNEISVRCLSCRSTPITLSLVSVLQRVAPDLRSKDVYELSSRGPLVKYLAQTSKTLSCSGYFKNTTPGDYNDAVQCQDVQRLTYASESFDVCTSTEVFEHVPDDARGFSEIQRVLRPNGVFVFTVPLSNVYKTTERAMLTSGREIQHLLPPEYHNDPVRGHEPILAFRNYGYDILDNLLKQGFRRAEIRSPGNDFPWGYTRPVVVAYREMVSNNWLNSDPLLLRFAPQ